MHIYNFGYSTYDTTEYKQLSFRKKLSQKEFEGFIRKAAVKALGYALKHREEFYWEFGGEGISIEHLYPRIVDELVALGFRPVKFDAGISYDGWEPLHKAVRLPKKLREKAGQISKQSAGTLKALP